MVPVLAGNGNMIPAQLAQYTGFLPRELYFSGRRALVADRLDDLRGPVAGRVELPLRLFWSLPGHAFDLDDPDLRRWYYQTVLREASRAADLTSYLDGATLIRLWPDLDLPAGVRRAWEEAHQPLRATVRA